MATVRLSPRWKTPDGAIVSVFAPSTVIIDGDDSTQAAVAQLSTVTAASPVDAPLDVSALQLDDATAEAVAAWNQLFDPDYIASKQNRFRDGETWDTPRGMRPRGGCLVSISMTQAVAVGIVVVDGPPGSSAAFTDGERLTIAVEVSQGFDILYQLSTLAAVPTNPHLIFVSETQHVTLSIDPTTIPAPTGNATPAEYVPCETPWRDAALAAMGFPAGAGGVSAYVQTLMSKAWPVAVTPGSAYVAFITVQRSVDGLH